MNNTVEIKVETLIEEAFMSGFYNAAEKALMELDKIFSTDASLKKVAEAEKRAQARRLQYLKENNIDVNEFKKILKSNKPVDIKMSLIMEELLDDIKNTTPVEIFKLIVVVTLLGIFHSTLIGMIMPFFSGKDAHDMALLVVAILIAPFSEELFKRISIQKRQAAQTYIGFNMFEATGYIIKMTGMGIPMAVAVFVRILAALMHLLTTSHHIKGNILDKYREDFGIKSEDKNEYKNQAQNIAAAIHTIWNSGLAPISAALGAIKLGEGEPIGKEEIEFRKKAIANIKNSTPNKMVLRTT
jgi:hypothetical protein